MRALRAKSKSSLFLIELLIIIAFFSVASVVCVRLFARAHILSTESHDLNRAMTVAQSAAECFKAAQGDPEKTASLLDGSAEGGRIFLYYDKDWQPVPEQQEHSYIMAMSVSSDGGFAVADIEVENASDTVFSLQVLQHRGAVS